MNEWRAKVITYLDDSKRFDKSNENGLDFVQIGGLEAPKRRASDTSWKKKFECFKVDTLLLPNEIRRNTMKIWLSDFQAYSVESTLRAGERRNMWVNLFSLQIKVNDEYLAVRIK